MKFIQFVLYTQILFASADDYKKTDSVPTTNSDYLLNTPYQQCLKDHYGQSSFEINGASCFCAQDGCVQCTDKPKKTSLPTSTPPSTPPPTIIQPSSQHNSLYQKCLESHGGKSEFEINRATCFCMRDGTVECIGVNSPLDPLQQCLKDHGGKSEFITNGVSCFCMNDGSIKCTGINAPLDPLQQCIKDHNGQSIFTINGAACSCAQDGTVKCN
ncbi:hypothetical protein BB559_002226 [Furculomyces boomerangus]|uniref:Uncharacterized protein n=2 Tax=Harpellales TaxID=61421 RepID=A0A2T9YX56_9FUNG|nr:hypothetical protein BB559_002226 [Furculomyces boomerangus]PVZ97149.1 hypothetical protein BB558_006905 [Smittium angustum]